MKTKVFIPSVPTRYDEASGQRVPSVDLNPAVKFGTLTVMSAGLGTIEDRINEVKRMAQKITPTDYILCVGDVVLTATAIAVTSRKKMPIQLLRWDKKSHRYNTVEVSI